VPEDLPDAAAGTAYINPLTAWLMVERFCAAGVREVVITAATSTIAGHLAQLLSTRGITPIGLVRGTPGRAVAEPSLWRDVLATSDPAWPDRLRHVAGGRTDVVLDCVGGAQGALLMEFLAPGGVLVHYGLLSGEPLPRACFDGRRGTRVELFHLRETVHSMPRHELTALFGPVFEHLRAGRLLTPCAQEVPLSRLPDALRDHRRRPASSSSTAGDDCCGVGSGLLFARRGAEQEVRLLGGQGRHRQRRRAPTLRTDPVEEDPQVAAVELRQVVPADHLAAAVGHLRQDGERDLQEDQVHAGQTGAATISTTVTRACSSCCAPSTESVRQENPHE